jgi:hypothetical protein
MKKFRIMLTALVAGLLVSTAGAGEEFDPAARAKVVAPFIETQTAAVVHVDLSRVAIDPLFETLAGLNPEAAEDMQKAKAGFAGAVGGLTQLGVHDVYLVFSTSFNPPRPPWGLLVLKPGVDAACVRAAVPGFQAATKQVGEVLVFAEREEILVQLGGLQPDDRPELAKVFEAAGDTAIQVAFLPPKHFARVIEETLPELPREIGGGPSTIITRGALWAAISLDLPPHASARFVIQSQDAPAAEALVRKIGDVLRFLGGLPETKKFVPQFDQIAAKLTPKAEQDQLVLMLDEAGAKGLLEVLRPPLERARLAAKRTQSVLNLKQIGIAMHNYHDVHKTFPPAAKCDPNGKPLLSWRVLILPYLDQQSLFQQFHLDEPWDSPHNKALIGKMPAVYRSPLSKLADRTRTNYLLPVGPAAAFAGPKCIQFKEVRDGTSNTVMTLEADDSHAVVWTKPDDLSFDPKDPLKGLGGLMEDGFHAGIMDGSVRYVSKTISPDLFKALVTPDGGEPIDFSSF